MASDLVYAAEKQPIRVEDISQSQDTPGQLTRPARSLVDHPSQLLHPIDTGVHAWLFVFSSFTLEFFVWGFAFRYVLCRTGYPFMTIKSLSTLPISRSVMVFSKSGF